MSATSRQILRPAGPRMTILFGAGGGAIGTAIAWRAAAAGLDVMLVDPGRGDAASLVAAGMLAPASEALFGEGALLRLNLLAVHRFGSFAAELEETTEITDFDGAILLFPSTINLYSPAYRQALAACGAPPLGLPH